MVGNFADKLFEAGLLKGCAKERYNREKILEPLWQCRSGQEFLREVEGVLVNNPELFKKIRSIACMKFNGDISEANKAIHVRLNALKPRT